MSPLWAHREKCTGGYGVINPVAWRASRSTAGRDRTGVCAGAAWRPRARPPHDCAGTLYALVAPWRRV